MKIFNKNIVALLFLSLSCCINICNTEPAKSFEINEYSRPSYINNNTILIAPCINRVYYLMVIEADTGKINKIFRNTEDEAWYVQSYSKKNDLIVFGKSLFKGRSIELFTIDTDGNNERQITFADKYSVAPIFSEIDNKIIFKRSEKHRFDYTLFSIDISGTNETKLSDEIFPIVGYPLCSSDGENIYFLAGELSNPYNRSICMFNIETKKKSVLKKFTTEYIAAISIDKNDNLFYSIIFENDKNELSSSDMYLLNKTDGSATLFATKLPWFEYFCFSPFEDKIVFDHPLNRLYEYDINTKELRRIKIQFNESEWEDIIINK